MIGTAGINTQVQDQTRGAPAREHARERASEMTQHGQHRRLLRREAAAQRHQASSRRGSSDGTRGFVATAITAPHCAWRNRK
jgi:hypothetical protein